MLINSTATKKVLKVSCHIHEVLRGIPHKFVDNIEALKSFCIQRRHTQRRIAKFVFYFYIFHHDEHMKNKTLIV